MPGQRIVDAHQHFWQLDRNPYPWLSGAPHAGFRYGDYAGLKRNYLPADLDRDAAGQDVVATVHVEAEWSPDDPVGETRWLHALAERHGHPNAVVGQAWFARGDIAEVLAGHAAFPLTRGVREKPRAAAAPDRVVPGAPGSMGDPAWRRGFALLERHGMSYDLQTPWWHLGEAADLARDFPGTQIIVNHTGLPADRSAAGLDGWRRAMERAAAAPNVALKISGLGLEDASWPVESNRAIVREAIGLFGTARCMFASNYPVDSLVATYDTIFNNFQNFVADFPAVERDALFYGNAVRVYRLAL